MSTPPKKHAKISASPCLADYLMGCTHPNVTNIKIVSHGIKIYK